MIKAADTDVITGSKATFILVDETHVFAKKAKAADVFVEIRGSLAARPTGSCCRSRPSRRNRRRRLSPAELTNRARRARRQGHPAAAADPVRAAGQGRRTAEGRQGWQDPALWPLINPNMDRRSIRRSSTRTDQGEARTGAAEAGAAGIAALQRRRSASSFASDRWAGAEFWARSAGSSHQPRRTAARSEVVVVGIDGGGLDDLLGLWRHRPREERPGSGWSGAMHGRTRSCSSGAMEDRLALKDFEAEGTLTIVEKPGDDVTEVCDIVMQCEESGKLAEKHAIAVDAAGISDIFNELTSEERGIEPERIVGIDQGWKLNGAIKTAERKVAGGELIHDGSKLMNWCVGNAKAEQRGMP
jgi:phage terminase large subunit-like protein